MRVLHLSYTENTWGAEQVVLNVAPHLAALGIDQVLAAPPGGTYEQRWRALGLDFHPLPVVDLKGLRTGDGGRPGPAAVARDAVGVARSAARVRAALRSTGAHIVHSHTKNAHLPAVLGANAARRASVVHLHDLVVPGVGRKVQGFIVRRSSATVAISEAVAACVEGRATTRVTVVPNGIDLEHFAPGPVDPALRASLTGAAEAPLVLAVCRVTVRKGVHDLIEAVAPLEGVHLVVVGDPPPGAEAYAADVRTLSAARLGDRGHFVGRRTDVPDLMRSSDVLAHAAVAEPYGLVLAEALACALPVVATNGGGAPEVVRDAGVLVAPGDVAAMTDGLRALLAAPERRAEMGLAGRRVAEEIGDSAEQAARLAAVYRRITR